MVDNVWFFVLSWRNRNTVIGKRSNLDHDTKCVANVFFLDHEEYKFSQYFFQWSVLKCPHWDSLNYFDIISITLRSFIKKISSLCGGMEKILNLQNKIKTIITTVGHCSVLLLIFFTSSCKEKHSQQFWNWRKRTSCQVRDWSCALVAPTLV